MAMIVSEDGVVGKAVERKVLLGVVEQAVEATRPVGTKVIPGVKVVLKEITQEAVEMRHGGRGRWREEGGDGEEEEREARWI
jgi:hypothetical protein